MRDDSYLTPMRQALRRGGLWPQRLEFKVRRYEGK